MIMEKSHKSENISIPVSYTHLGNIKEVRSSASKVTVVLVNQQLVDIDKIKALGASGIVEGASSLAMIFGRQSENIAADLRRYIG